jgi:hypothetical protein
MCSSSAATVPTESKADRFYYPIVGVCRSYPWHTAVGMTPTLEWKPRRAPTPFSQKWLDVMVDIELGTWIPYRRR